MISFENTEIAFKSKTNSELLHGYRMFKVISSNTVVAVSNFFARIAIAIKFPLAWAVKPTVYRHFVGGETIPEAMNVVKKLESFGVRGILDYSVEGTETEVGIKNAFDETLRTIENAAKHKLPFVVFKPTALTTHAILTKVSAGEKLTDDEAKQADGFRERVDNLCSAAHKVGIPILIDAEETWFQQFIDEVTDKNMEKYNKEKAIVFNTFQMYRHDRLEFLRISFEKAVAGNYYLGAKFVRGAYMEKERERAKLMGYPSPIQPDKEATDRDYNLALKFCIEHIDRIAIFNGTHNEYSANYMVELMKEHGIAPTDTRCYFSQLYGMSDHISFNVANEGYNVAKYIPYGPVSNVLPYLLRRIEENTSIAGQTGRELRLITIEMNRRKQISKK
ncbi:MAG TPA: proline dehydrogenase [Bacteroidales bacterium]|nr:proline dehydrogenase [Bacteroidales bacterium]